MDPRATNPCQLCGHGVATEAYKFIRQAFGAWPEVRVAIPVCPSCKAGMTGGRFAGGPGQADKIRKNLQRLTGRPWEWSVLRPHGRFTVGEAAITTRGPEGELA